MVQAWHLNGVAHESAMQAAPWRSRHRAEQYRGATPKQPQKYPTDTPELLSSVF
ncbi:hypothetical protein SynRS9902_01730 [Synechococcus sp. RS9902]|nr:hypothetical protein SynRS9902_01730 [Synechococcus sp. RS9902]